MTTLNNPVREPSGGKINWTHQNTWRAYSMLLFSSLTLLLMVSFEMYLSAYSLDRFRYTLEANELQLRYLLLLLLLLLSELRKAFIMSCGFCDSTWLCLWLWVKFYENYINLKTFLTSFIANVQRNCIYVFSFFFLIRFIWSPIWIDATDTFHRSNWLSNSVRFLCTVFSRFIAFLRFFRMTNWQILFK